MKVIIPLAGKGTRLRPHTHLTPKPLLQVAGQPVMSYVLERLKALEIEELIFITGHLKGQVEEYVKKNYPNFKTRFIEQSEQTGTASAVALAKDYVRDDVLIVFVDTIFNADISLIKNLNSNLDGVIWVKEVEDYQRFGVVVGDENGVMKKIVEKPTEPISKLANIGLYYIRDSKLMFEGIDYVLKRELEAGKEFYLTDAFQYMVDKGAKIRIEPVKDWYDAGQKDTLIETNRHLLEGGRANKPVVKAGVRINQPVYIADNVELEDSEIGPNVTISGGSRIVRSRLQSSIVGADTAVEDSTLHDSLIGNNSVIRGISGSVSVVDHSEMDGEKDSK